MNEHDVFDSYECMICGELKQGIPGKAAGATGAMCPDCLAINVQKGLETKKIISNKTKGFDRWTGEKIMPSDMPIDGEGHVSKSSRRNLDWLLRGVRYSPLMAHHVARIEAREKPHREERRKEEARLLSSNKKQITSLRQEINSIPENIVTIERLIRLELLMEKLISKIN